MEARTALNIVVSPSTKEEVLAVYALRQWCRYNTMTNNFFELTDLNDMQDAYDRLCVWFALTAENSAASYPKAAADYLSKVLNLRDAKDMCRLFCGNNKESLRDAHIAAPITYNGSVADAHNLIHTPKPATAAPIVVPAASKANRTVGSRDHQTWRGISIPAGRVITEDRRKNPKNWYVAYSFTEGVTPLMYPGDPKKNGFADTDYRNGTNDYLNAVRNKFAEEAMIANVDVRIMSYKRWLDCDGNPQPRQRKVKAS